MPQVPPTSTPPSTIDASNHSPHQQAPLVPSSHDIQLRYKLASPTFQTLSTISKSASRQDILKKACFATEFRLFPIKQAEKAFLREVNDHTAIPYPVAENLSQPWHKIFLLVQLDLLGIEWPRKISADARKELHANLGYMYKLLDQALRCLVDILGERNDGKGVSVALDVLRSVKAGVWEGSDKQLLQIDGIGRVKMDRLVQAGITTIQHLSSLEFYHIERLLSRNPPFGQKMVHELAGFPKLSLDLEVLDPHIKTITSRNADDVSEKSEISTTLSPSVQSWIVRITLGFSNDQVPSWKKIKPWTTLVVEGQDGRLVWFWRGNVKRLTGGKEMVICVNATKEENLKVTFACEEIVGTMIEKTIVV